MTKIRSFIAINLPPDIKNYLGNLVNDLKRLNPSSNFKWVRPEGLHFTLHFLGYLDEKQLEQVKKIIQQSVDQSPTVTATLEALDGFPNLNRPRVLFVGCQEIGNRTIKKIQARIGKQLEEIGNEVDQRTWQMHITLARLKVPDKIRLSKTKIQELKFTIQGVDLMKSELSREGAHYTILQPFPLK
jgi:2'-5' RNA ligase